jgi:hypothetical protein
MAGVGRDGIPAGGRFAEAARRLMAEREQHAATLAASALGSTGQAAAHQDALAQGRAMARAVDQGRYLILRAIGGGTDEQAAKVVAILEDTVIEAAEPGALASRRAALDLARKDQEVRHAAERAHRAELDLAERKAAVRQAKEAARQAGRLAGVASGAARRDGLDARNVAIRSAWQRTGGHLSDTARAQTVQKRLRADWPKVAKLHAQTVIRIAKRP